ncbi:MAG: nucleotidyltransferase domain-containing protein [Infirmifilum sp.]
MPERSSSGLSVYLKRRARLLEQRDAQLREFAARISQRLGPCRVLLFGSRARGSQLPYSDYDVAVIVEKTGTR